MSDADHAIVLFPGAGSFGGEFSPLLGALRPAAWLVRYPGRYGRNFGAATGSFEVVVQACAKQIANRAAAGPVLFGHSYGAYVAYATALRLREAGIKICALVATGASAPGLAEVPEQASATASAAVDYLTSVDPSALADAPSDEWREIIAETAAGDLRLLRQFDAARATSLHCPILAARGDADALTSDAGIGEWARYSDGGFSRRVFPGGHSDFLRSPAFASWIRLILDRLASSEGVCHGDRQQPG